MIGYKAFNNDMTCRDFKYIIGNIYEMNEKPIICKQGFHFCRKLEDVFDYYPFYKTTKVCEVEAYGDIDTKDNIKFCTNKIKICEEVDFNDLFEKQFSKKATSKSIDLSSIKVGTKLHVKDHILICVSIQDNKYVFAFNEVMTLLSAYEIQSFISNLDNFKEWLSQEWLDNISEIFIPNKYEVLGDNIFTTTPKEKLRLLPFLYYGNKKNRIKKYRGTKLYKGNVYWWLSSVAYSTNFVYINGDGNVSYASASYPFGVVPHFIIER